MKYFVIIYWDSRHSFGPSEYKNGPKTGYKGEKKVESAKIAVTDREDIPKEESRTVTIPFRHSNSSSWFFPSSNSSTSRSKSVFSCRVKISFRTSRWSIPKESLFSSSWNSDLTSCMLLCFSSGIRSLQIATSCSRQSSSSRTWIILSSKLLYSFRLLSNDLTFPKSDHSSRPFKRSFKIFNLSAPRKPFCSNSTNNGKTSCMFSSSRGATFPLHITSNCLPTFSSFSLLLILKSKLLYSIADIFNAKLTYSGQLLPNHGTRCVDFSLFVTR